MQQIPRYNIPYIELTEREWGQYGPTGGVAEMVKRLKSTLKDAGVEQGNIDDLVIDAGQGAEIELWRDKATYGVLSHGITGFDTGEYHTDTRGNDEEAADPLYVSKAISHYMSTAYRLPATTNNTFLYQDLGRRGVEMAMHDMAFDIIEDMKAGIKVPGPINMILSKKHWGTLSASARNQHLNPLLYDNHHRNTNGDCDPAEAIITAIDSVDPVRIGGILINYPLNPTSQRITTGQMKRVFNHVSQLNKQTGVNIRVLLDNPYGFACPVLGDSRRNRHLDTGMQHVLDDVTNVDWTVVVSMSKLFGLAPIGSSIMVVNEERAGLMQQRLGLSGTGIGRFQQLSTNIAKMIGGENDKALWGRKRILRTKYQKCRDFLEGGQKSGNYTVVEGSANMLSEVEVPVDGVLGREVEVHPGQKRVITDGKDLATFMLNKYFMAVVDNGVIGDNQLIRLASREAPQRYARLIDRFNAALEDVRGVHHYDEISSSPPHIEIPDPVFGATNYAAAPANG